jgi:N-acetylmuramoyl-L-alanine amidase
MKLTTLLLLLTLSTHAEVPRDLIAAVLVEEAASGGYTGMSAVMNVIDNRAGDPSNYAHVVTRPKQFSCLNKVTAGRIPASKFVSKARKKEGWDTARRIVDLAVSGQLLDITAGATHYHATRITPKWARPSLRTIRIKNHIFYKLT